MNKIDLWARITALSSKIKMEADAEGLDFLREELSVGRVAVVILKHQIQATAKCGGVLNAQKKGSDPFFFSKIEVETDAEGLDFLQEELSVG